MFITPTVLSFCLPERSNGGDCHLGTAHSNTTQGRYLLFSLRFSLHLSVLKPILVSVSQSLLVLLSLLPSPSPAFILPPILSLTSCRKCAYCVHSCRWNRQNRGVITELFFCMILSHVFFLAVQLKLRTQKLHFVHVFAYKLHSRSKAATAISLSAYWQCKNGYIL